MRELNMKLSAVVSLEKYRADGNWHKKTSKKAVPIETKELLVCLLNPCYSSIHFFIISRVLLLPDETAKTVKKANYITLINNYQDKTLKYCKFWICFYKLFYTSLHFHFQWPLEFLVSAPPPPPPPHYKIITFLLKTNLIFVIFFALVLCMLSASEYILKFSRKTKKLVFDNCLAYG